MHVLLKPYRKAIFDRQPIKQHKSYLTGHIVIVNQKLDDWPNCSRPGGLK